MNDLNTIIEIGKEDIKTWGIDNFIVIEYLNPRHFGDMLYKYELIEFSEYDDLLVYLKGDLAFDWLDTAIRFHKDKEKIVYAYSKSKLIINERRF